MYYLRSKPAANAIQFTVDQVALAKKKTAEASNNSTNSNKIKSDNNEDAEKAKAVEACRRDNPEACVMCSG